MLKQIYDIETDKGIRSELTMTIEEKQLIYQYIIKIIAGFMQIVEVPEIFRSEIEFKIFNRKLELIFLSELEEE